MALSTFCMDFGTLLVHLISITRLVCYMSVSSVSDSSFYATECKALLLPDIEVSQKMINEQMGIDPQQIRK